MQTSISVRSAAFGLLLLSITVYPISAPFALCDEQGKRARTSARGTNAIVASVRIRSGGTPKSMRGCAFLRNGTSSLVICIHDSSGSHRYFSDVTIRLVGERQDTGLEVELDSLTVSLDRRGFSGGIMIEISSDADERAAAFIRRVSSLNADWIDLRELPYSDLFLDIAFTNLVTK